MIHSMLVMFLTVLGVSYGRHWTNLEELETYLTTHYDESLDFETPDNLGVFTRWNELPLRSSYLDYLPEMWPSGVVPFQIVGQASDEELGIIYESMRDIESVSCITFIPSEHQVQEPVKINVGGEGCFSGLGFSKSGVSLNLGEGCVYKNVIIHELLHALGRNHQHTVSNRDEYVTVHWENIQPEFKDSYVKQNIDLPAEHEFGYDYDSIMHYTSNGFSVGDDHPTMTAKDPNVQLTEKYRMSHKDVKKLNRMYDCIGS